MNRCLDSVRGVRGVRGVRDAVVHLLAHSHHGSGLLGALLVTLAGTGCGSQDPARPAVQADDAATSTGSHASVPADLVSTGTAADDPVKADSGPHDPGPAGDLRDEAAERGLDHVNRSGGPEKATILEANGAGVALLDLAVDGDLDVVFTQGLGSLEQLTTGPGADVEVYENDGSGRFRRTDGPGLAGWWTGLAAGDVDSDGDTDLVVGGFGDLVLLVQESSGQLAPRADALPMAPGRRLKVGEKREPGRPPSWVTSLALLDADRDGVLDLYVGRYLDFDPVAPPRGELGSGALAVPCRWKGHEVFCGPRGMQPQADRILRGRGDGTFEDASARWLPDHVPGFTLGLVASDIDADGDTDLFVANDSSPNLLLINAIDPVTSGGGLRDVAYTAGVALSRDGMAEAGMGAAAADIDRDGLVDLAVTNFSDEPTALYKGTPTGFEDVTYLRGLQRESRRLLSWSVHLCDFDGDTWPELFTANGHVFPQADRPQTGTSYAQPDSLWRLGPPRDARARVERVAPASPRSILALERGTRGSAVGDVDSDGDPDIVLATIDGPAGLGINSMSPGNARLAIRCLGPASPPDPSQTGPRTPADALGTRLAVVLEDEDGPFALLGEVQTAEGYQSASSPWVHFGLGAQGGYTSIRIFWPSGRVEELPGGAAGRRLTIREGAGIVAEENLE